jgi:dTMP kinase
VHSTAVYQSLISHPDDDEAAHRHVHAILNLAAAWRPLPDRAILLTDDVTAAIHRAERRDGIQYTTEQWRLHHRAATLFTRLAVDDPDHVTALDVRGKDTDAIVDQLAGLINSTSQRRTSMRPDTGNLAACA